LEALVVLRLAWVVALQPVVLLLLTFRLQEVVVRRVLSPQVLSSFIPLIIFQFQAYFGVGGGAAGGGGVKPTGDATPIPGVSAYFAPSGAGQAQGATSAYFAPK
jgi:hypothetical protein